MLCKTFLIFSHFTALFMATSNFSQYSIVFSLSQEQIFLLKQILQEQNWSFSEAPYCHFKASGNKVSIAAYQSGKTVIQGKNAHETVEFIVEPLVLKNCSYTQSLLESADPGNDPLEFIPHAGIDESGKGDLFQREFRAMFRSAYLPYSFEQRVRKRRLNAYLGRGKLGNK